MDRFSDARFQLLVGRARGVLVGLTEPSAVAPDAEGAGNIN